jgi:hypothetical protein
MTLNNGNRIVTASKPKYKNGAYHYRDGSGTELSIPQGRVVEIAPSSKANSKQNQFRTGPGSVAPK